MHLASQVNTDQEKQRLLGIAGLLHDLGTPPGTHCTEAVMKYSLGLTHEQLAQRLVLESNELQNALKSMEIPVDKLLELMSGKGIGQIICSPLGIDLDNLIGPIELGHSMGLRKQPECDLLQIVKGFSCRNGSPSFSELLLPQLRLAMSYRMYVYAHIMRNPFTSLWAMQTRILQLAFERRRFDLSFFRFTDPEFWSYMRDLSLEGIDYITTLMDKGDTFKPIWEMDVDDKPEQLLREDAHQDSWTGALADDLARALRVRREQVAISFRHNTTPRNLQIPILSVAHQLIAPKPVPLHAWKILVFLAPGLRRETEKARAYCQERFGTVLQSV